MPVLQNMTVKSKLVSVIMLTCVASMVVAGATLAARGWSMSRSDMVRSLSTQAEMIAENCKAALVFQDAKDAEKTLGALHVEPSIIFGCVYTKDKKIFATYYRDYAEIKVHPLKFQEDSFAFSEGSLTIFRPIVLEGEIIGTVCLRSDMSPMYAMLKRNTNVIFIVLLLSSLVAFLMSSRLQNVISKPILSLAKVAKVVSEEKDYSARAVKHCNDEVGSLIDAFNEMLGQIQHRDAELVNAKEKLEIRVEERTAELTSANEQLTQKIAERKEIEEKLRKAEEKYRTQFEGAMDAIFVADAETDILVDCNPAATKLVGWEKSELIGQHQKILHPAEDIEGEFSKIFKEHLKEKQGQTLETQVITKTGELRNVAIMASLLEISGKKVLQGIFRDITKRKQAEEALRKSEEFTRRVIESSDDCITVLDLEGHLLSMSEGGQRLLEVDDIAPYLNMSFVDFWKGKEREDCLAAVSKAKQGNTGTFYGYFETAKGTPKWWEIIVSPIKDADNSINRLLAVSRDITERRKAEETMKQLNKDLESTVAKLGRANNELKDFVYIASHDLREPLRKISVFGEILSESLKNKLNDDEKENLGFMIDGAKRMQQMIDALLTYSRVSTQGVDLKVVDLNKIVEELRNVELAVKIEETRAKIIVPEQLQTVNGDPAQIRQLMQNFIANGLKYQKKGAIPQITIRSSAADNDMVRVEVADNGIGIKQEHFKNLFIMFKRLHSTQEYEGSGIGLAVCKKIVERHGGDIGVSSTYGEGSTFWFTIPASKPSKEKQAELVSSYETGVRKQGNG
jgi:PAS domain S-box-containing protein